MASCVLIMCRMTSAKWLARCKGHLIKEEKLTSLDAIYYAKFVRFMEVRWELFKVGGIIESLSWIFYDFKIFGVKCGIFMSIFENIIPLIVE